MKKYILIQNDGEIESNSFELIGASTKRNDSTKIGFFGSGLKYSIAFLMRNNIDFKIFSGVNELVFTTQSEVLKDQSFERICINGKQTSYTTTMGPTWEFQWFVLREIYCNAIDEGSCQMVKETSDVNSTAGKTRIYIELTGTLQAVIDKWDSYFSDERTPLFVAERIHTSFLDSRIDNQSIKCYQKTSGVLYRKGVRVYNYERHLFDYELDSITINEDRTAKNTGALQYAFCSMAIQFCNEDWVLSVLRNKKSYEYDALTGTSIYGIPNTAWIQFSNDFLLVVDEISGKFADKIQESAKEALFIPKHFAHHLKKLIPGVNILGMGKIIGKTGMENVEPTEKMKFLLKEVIQALKEMDYEYDYPVSIVSFHEDKILGKADIQLKKIYLSDTLFDMGRREIATCIMEECEHIRSGAEDETRKFQNHIFNRWLSCMENATGLFL